MGTYVNNNIVTLGAEVDYDNAVSEIAGLLSIGTRADGMHHFVDVCTANSIKMWAKNKPIKNAKTANITEDDRMNANYGLYIPAMTWPEIVNSTNDAQRFWQYEKPTGPPYEYYRVRDFNGYNHVPVGLTMRLRYEAIYSGTEAKFYVNVGNIGSTDIPMDKVTVEKDTIEATKVSIASMSLYLLITIGSSRYIVNTGKSFTNASLGEATISFAIPNNTSGSTLKVYALLGNTSYIPSGTTQLTSTTDTMAQVKFVPLSLSSAMEAEKSVTIADYALLPNLSVSYDFTIPIPEGRFELKNMSLTAETGGAKSAEVNVEIYLRRYSGSSYTTIVGGNQTISGTFAAYSGSLYRFAIGTLNLNKPAAAIAGDRVYLKVSVTKLAGSTPASQYQIVYEQQIHTMTNNDLDSLT